MKDDLLQSKERFFLLLLKPLLAQEKEDGEKRVGIVIIGEGG